MPEVGLDGLWRCLPTQVILTGLCKSCQKLHRCPVCHELGGGRRNWPAKGRSLLSEEAVAGAGLGGDLQGWALLDPVPRWWYAIQCWAVVSYVEVTCFWYESSRGSRMLLLYNLMGIYLTKHWTWFIKTAFCAASYWVGLCKWSCNNLPVKGIICICIDFYFRFLASYNSLTDKHLVGYFKNTRIRRHLQRSGLVRLKSFLFWEKKKRILCFF